MYPAFPKVKGVRFAHIPDFPGYCVGEKHGIAKLSNQDVRRIRSRLAKGESQASLARVFGVSQTAISLVKRGRTWTHVRGDDD